jgi:hypothetical protein
VLEVKTREGHRATWFPPGAAPIDELASLWRSRKEQLVSLADFFPTRLVTLIEVFTRRWLERLIDHGQPYLGNAADLERQGMKLDFATTMAIQGRRVSLGQLLAHGVSLNRLEQIAACFTQVLGEDLFDSIRDAYDRYKVERLGEPKIPIIPDLERMKSDLARLFTVRHIIVHETPSKPPYTVADVDDFLASAIQFARATEQTLQDRLYPGYPLTIRDADEEAARAHAAAKRDLEDVLAQVEGVVHGFGKEALRESQEAWGEYAGRQSKLRACGLEGGRLQTGVRVREATRLIGVRIEELRWWLDREEGEI